MNATSDECIVLRLGMLVFSPYLHEMADSNHAGRKAADEPRARAGPSEEVLGSALALPFFACCQPDHIT
jgi:hypothetical protein